VRAAFIFGVNLLVAVAALGWVLHRYGGAAIALLAEAPSVPLLAAFASTVATGLVALALRWGILLAGLRCHLGAGRLAASRAAGHSVSSLIPSAKLGGEPLRVWLAIQHHVAAPQAIASVAADRTLEFGANWMFAAVFATVLAQQGVPALRGALVTMCAAGVGLVVGIVLTVRRLRRGGGLLTALAQGTGLDRFTLVRKRMQTLADAETALAVLVDQPGRLVVCFAIGVAANVVVLVEYWLLLATFGLPAVPLTVVAAIFATGAAHSMPVPGGVGVLEGGQMWLFTMLGYPPDVGLAIGLAVRLRELLWTLPGLLYLTLYTLRRSAKEPTRDFVSGRKGRRA
jgi:uncharacterized protein (TIRG00374 family)